MQQSRACTEREARRKLCKKAACEINDLNVTVVNILLNNILIQRGLTSHEQWWEDMKTARTANDEITVGTEHSRSDEWSGRGHVSSARLMPDLVWLRCDSEGQWRKVVVDVKITSTEEMNKAF